MCGPQILTWGKLSGRQPSDEGGGGGKVTLVPAPLGAGIRDTSKVSGDVEVAAAGGGIVKVSVICGPPAAGTVMTRLEMANCVCVEGEPHWKAMAVPGAGESASAKVPPASGVTGYCMTLATKPVGAKLAGSVSRLRSALKDSVAVLALVPLMLGAGVQVEKYGCGLGRGEVGEAQL